MSVAVWNCQSRELNVSTGGVYLTPYLKVLTHIWSWSLHLTSSGGYIWPISALHLKTWPAKMSFNNNIPYYTWKIWALIVEISVTMSVAMWNCHCWPLHVSSSVKLPVLRTQCQHWGGYIQQPIWVLHLKILTHIWSWSLHLTSSGGYIWPISALHLKTWPAKMSFNNNIPYYTWQIWALIVEISVTMSVTMWICHSWPLDVSSNVKLPFLTTRCQ